MRYVHISTCWTPIQPAIPGLSRQVPVAGGMSYPTTDGTRTERKGRHGAVNLKSMCWICWWLVWKIVDSFIQSYIDVCMYVCMYIYIFMYIFYICVHLYIYIYVHICICGLLKNGKNYLFQAGYDLVMAVMHGRDASLDMFNWSHGGKSR